MTDYVLVKTGRRLSRAEWTSLGSTEQDILLKREGPLYTDEAWKNNFGNRKPKR